MTRALECVGAVAGHVYKCIGRDEREVDVVRLLLVRRVEVGLDVERLHEFSGELVPVLAVDGVAVLWVGREVAK